MIQPSVENRTFFNESIVKYIDTEKTKKGHLPHAAFVKAVMGVKTLEDAVKFVSGHLHWLQGKKPQTLEAAMDIIRANVAWCYEEQMTSETVEMWRGLLGEAVVAPVRTSEQVFPSTKVEVEKAEPQKETVLLPSLAKLILKKQKGG